LRYWERLERLADEEVGAEVSESVAELGNKRQTATERIRAVLSEYYNSNPLLSPTQYHHSTAKTPAIVLTPPQSEVSFGMRSVVISTSAPYQLPTPVTLPPPTYHSWPSLHHPHFSHYDPRASTFSNNEHMVLEPPNYMAYLNNFAEMSYYRRESLHILTLFSSHNIPYTNDPYQEFELIMHNVYTKLLLEQGVPW
jgi:hypothetical protein